MTWIANANVITFILVLSATKLVRDGLRRETGNGRALSLSAALLGDGSLNACPVMLTIPFETMNTTLKTSKSRVLEKLTAWFLYLNGDNLWWQVLPLLFHR